MVVLPRLLLMEMFDPISANSFVSPSFPPRRGMQVNTHKKNIRSRMLLWFLFHDTMIVGILHIKNRKTVDNLPNLILSNYFSPVKPNFCRREQT
ncbi:MAG: hypothetical protein K0R57_3897 [Paenibacillaceae bacterium]|jgi:hypothetical protein|nr:hypothetical protein [Paenibacillaceae bacterium]